MTDIRNFWNASKEEKIDMMDVAGITGIVPCPRCQGTGVIIIEDSISPGKSRKQTCGMCHGDTVVVNKWRSECS